MIARHGGPRVWLPDLRSSPPSLVCWLLHFFVCFFKEGPASMRATTHTGFQPSAAQDYKRSLWLSMRVSYRTTSQHIVTYRSISWCHAALRGTIVVYDYSKSCYIILQGPCSTRHYPCCRVAGGRPPGGVDGLEAAVQAAYHVQPWCY